MTARAGSVVMFGETLGLVYSLTTGPLAHAGTLGLGIGGAESNVAIGLVRLGRSARWAGRVGEDPLGDLVVREIRAEGVEVRAVRDASASTALMVKERRVPGSSRVDYYRRGSAGSRLCESDVSGGHFDSASLLHITGITPALSESASDAIDRAVAEATARAIPVSFDLNYRAALWTEATAAPVMRRLAAASTIVFAGMDEARLIAPHAESAAIAAEAIADLGPSEVVIKLGADGCFALSEGRASSAASIPVDVVDTVGAGDAFVAGYLSAYLEGANVEVRLATAVTAGAFACLSPDDWRGYATTQDLAALRDGRDPVRR